MSIRPTAADATGVTVYHDDPGRGHEAVVPWAQITAGVRLDGTPDDLVLTLPCTFPGCGSASQHPIGGGAAPREVQRLFVHLTKRAREGRTWNQAKAMVRTRVIRAEGRERWQLEDEDE